MVTAVVPCGVLSPLADCRLKTNKNEIAREKRRSPRPDNITYIHIVQARHNGCEQSTTNSAIFAAAVVILYLIYLVLRTCFFRPVLHRRVYNAYRLSYDAAAASRRLHRSAVAIKRIS